MRLGFKFKDKNSGDFERMVVKVKDIPFMPDVKETKEEAAGTDGSYDFSACNELGRNLYKDRTFQIEMTVFSENAEELNKVMGSIALWLNGEGQLILDSMADTVWNARIRQGVTFMPERGGKRATVTAVFIAEPFSESTFNVMDGPCLDYDIVLDSEIPLSLDTYFVFENQTSLQVLNVGTAPVKPVIAVTGVKTPFTITCNGKSLNVSEAPETVVIDFEKQYVTDGTNSSIMKNVSGTFFELTRKINEITLTSCDKVTVNYTPKFMYNAEISGFDLV